MPYATSSFTQAGKEKATHGHRWKSRRITLSVAWYIIICSPAAFLFLFMLEAPIDWYLSVPVFDVALMLILEGYPRMAVGTQYVPGQHRANGRCAHCGEHSRIWAYPLKRRHQCLRRDCGAVMKV